MQDKFASWPNRTWGSFYDLKLQLALGLLQRDYAVLCHGWRPDRSEIAAAVRWLGRLGRRPSEVAPGRRARTRLKAAAHLGRVGQACSAPAHMLRGMLSATERGPLTCFVK